MTREQKLKLFKEALDTYETEELREYTEDMIELMPEDSIVCPSSSSGKYHNATQCLLFGNLFHLLMMFSIGNYRLGLEHIKNQFPKSKQRDAIRTSLLLHDGVKYGWNGAQYTQFTHPQIAADWVRTTTVEHDIKQGLKDFIASNIESHSGEWSTSNRSKAVLPKPITAEQCFVHECDYLGSRNNIDMTYSDELLETIEEITNDMVDTFKFNFGKYNGKTVKEVFESNPGYFNYFESNGGLREPIKTIVERLK